MIFVIAALQPGSWLGAHRRLLVDDGDGGGLLLRLGPVKCSLHPPGRPPDSVGDIRPTVLITALTERPNAQR